MKSILLLFVVGLLAAFCHAPRAQVAAEKATATVMRPGDDLVVVLTGIPKGIRLPVTVSSAGTVDVPPPVDCAIPTPWPLTNLVAVGRTPEALAQEINILICSPISPSRTHVRVEVIK